jgi:hypothetical protein
MQGKILPGALHTEPAAPEQQGRRSAEGRSTAGARTAGEGEVRGRASRATPHPSGKFTNDPHPAPTGYTQEEDAWKHGWHS